MLTSVKGKTHVRTILSLYTILQRGQGGSKFNEGCNIGAVSYSLTCQIVDDVEVGMYGYDDVGLEGAEYQPLSRSA